MSKGPGRVSRTIEATLEAEPDNVFTVEDLSDRVYRGIDRVEKNHRVAILRAAKAIVAHRLELAWQDRRGSRRSARPPGCAPRSLGYRAV